MSFISGRTTDGVISEPARASRVSTVFPNMPAIKSYVEAAADYYVVKPTSSFVLAPSDEFVRWRTNWGAAPSSCSLRNTMGPLARLYGFEDGATWSPSCWNLECPSPGAPAGSVADPFRPPARAFQPYSANVPAYNGTGRCSQACSALCRGPGDTAPCVANCLDECTGPTRFANTYGQSFAAPESDGDDMCRDSCAQGCSQSSNVNDCFAPCFSGCGGFGKHK